MQKAIRRPGWKMYRLPKFDSMFVAVSALSGGRHGEPGPCGNGRQQGASQCLQAQSDEPRAHALARKAFILTT